MRNNNLLKMNYFNLLFIESVLSSKNLINILILMYNMFVCFVILKEK